MVTVAVHSRAGNSLVTHYLCLPAEWFARRNNNHTFLFVPGIHHLKE